jgi:hypothetical protein
MMNDDIIDQAIELHNGEAEKVIQELLTKNVNIGIGALALRITKYHEQREREHKAKADSAWNDVHALEQMIIRDEKNLSDNAK